MIKELTVKNLALIEEAEVHFDDGLAILTGETGAGKSILIRSVYLILGGKAGREWIRSGTDAAYVEFVFTPIEEETKRILRDLEITAEDELILSRKITAGKSVARANGENITVAQLAQLASTLIVLHGQQEQNKLLEEKNHLAILDSDGGHDHAEKVGQVQTAFAIWQERQAQLDRMVTDEKERTRRLDLLEYEIAEIEQAHVRIGELEEVEQTYRSMMHAQKVRQAYEQVEQLVAGNDGIEERIGQAFRHVADAASYDAGFEELREVLQALESCAADAKSISSRGAMRASYTDQEIHETNERLDLLHRLEEKYHCSCDELESLKESKIRERDELYAFEEVYARKKQETKEAQEAYDRLAGALTKARKKIALDFSSKVEENLKDLDFLQNEFSVEISEKEPDETGRDRIVFLISMNPGEEAKPLARIASGGELSRIMLAIKTVLSDVDVVPTLVFDEIDTGISGKTAAKVGRRLKQLGASRQVICITHLPQIAALGDANYKIRKEVADARTRTYVARLDEEGVIDEIAQMLGGTTVTEAVRSTAREMRQAASE